MKNLILTLVIILAIFSCTKIEYTDLPVNTIKTLTSYSLKTNHHKPPTVTVVKVDTIIIRDTVYLVRETIIRDTIVKIDTVFTTNQSVITNTVYVPTEVVRWDTVFITVAPPTTLIDMDGNVYKTVKIGTQVWMQENLKTTKFNDGTDIPGPGNADGGWDLIHSCYYWFNFNIANKEKYGGYYSEMAIDDGRLCPMGWHLPYEYDFQILKDFLSANGYGFQNDSYQTGKSLASKTGWIVPQPTETSAHGFIPVPLSDVGINPDLNNSSGFNGYPAGVLNSRIIFENVGTGAFWGMGISQGKFPAFSLYNSSGSISEGFGNNDIGLNVRCLKNK